MLCTCGAPLTRTCNAGLPSIGPGAGQRMIAPGNTYPSKSVYHRPGLATLLERHIGQARMNRALVAHLDIRTTVHGHRAPAQIRQADAFRIALAGGVFLAPQARAIGEQRHRITHLKRIAAAVLPSPASGGFAEGISSMMMR